MTQDQIQAYHAEWYRWITEQHISEENLKFYLDESTLSARQRACATLEVFMARVVASDTVVGSVPASPRDWLVKYVLRAAPFMRRWLRVNEVNLLHRQEYRQCPHLKYDAQPHYSWLMYGHPFDSLAEEKRAAAYAVLDAAEKLYDAPNTEADMNGRLRLTHAVHRYRRSV